MNKNVLSRYIKKLTFTLLTFDQMRIVASAWELVGNFVIPLRAHNAFPKLSCIFHTYLEEAIFS